MHRKKFVIGSASAAAAVNLLGIAGSAPSGAAVPASSAQKQVGKIFAANLDRIANYPDPAIFKLLKQTAALPNPSAQQIEVALDLLGAYGAMPNVPTPIPPAAPLSFPADHGEHNDSTIEWRYFTLSLPLPNGGIVSVVANFFRKALVSSITLPSVPALSRQLYSTSIGVTIEMPGQPGVHYALPTTSFGAIDGGVVVGNEPFKMILGKNSIVGTGENVFPLHIHLEDGGDASVGRPPMVFDVDCAGTNPFFLQGVNGYVGTDVKPGELPAVGWYYYSWEHQMTTGTVTLGGTPYAVTNGTCWMDHQWGGGPMPASGPAHAWNGWCWFEFQFEGNRALTFANGHGPIPSGVLPPNLPGGGVYIDSSAHPTLVFARLNVGSYVQSPYTTGKYPSSWSADITDGAGINLHVVPTVLTEPQTLWMGSLTEYSEASATVTAVGTVGGLPVSLTGIGYCEGVGYEDPVHRIAREVAFLQAHLV